MVGLMKRYIRLGCWGMSCTKGWEYCITGFGKQWDRFTGAPNKGKNINHYISFNFLRSSITLHPALKCIGLCCKMCLHNMSLSKIWESTHLNKWELIMFFKKNCLSWHFYSKQSCCCCCPVILILVCKTKWIN